jgi:TolB-like protein
VTAHRDTVPTALETLVMRCLEKKPADRWQSADELLSQLEALATPSGGMTPTATGPVPGRRPWTTAAAGLLAAIAVVVLGWWFLMRDGGRADARFGDGVWIAVLPFENLSASDADEYFTDGVTRDVNTQLAKLDGFVVIEHGSAVRVSTTGNSYADMARDLGVDYLVAGSVRRDEGAVRVNASLIEPEMGAQLWTDALDAEERPGAIVQMQADIAVQVASALDVAVAPAERQRLAAEPTANPEAYDAYQLGRFYEAKRGRFNLRTAVQYFERAIAADSGYAHAWSGLADTYTLLLPATYGEDDAPAAELLDAAERAARRAIALDSAFAHGHASLGFALAEAWRWDEAAEAYQRAIALEPRLANAHHWYAYLLVSIGRMDEAVREIELARELDPISMIISNSGAGILAAAGRMREATATYERTAALHPDALLVLRDAAMHYLRMGEFERAAQYIEAWSRTWPQPDPERGRQWANRFREPATRAAALREMAVTDAFPLGPDLYMLSGDRDSALVVLERWSRERLEPGRLSPNMLQMYVLNEQLRREPLYRHMLERMGAGGGR